MKNFYSFLAVSLLAGSAWAQVTVPATLDIPDADTFATWTVIDNNAETSANTWTFGSAEALYTEDKSNNADDWLISPAVTLEAGVNYTIDYYIVQKSSYSSDSQSYAITVGNAATIEAQSTIIAQNESFKSKLYSKQSCTFTATESGTYYLGVHLYSNKWQGNCGFQKFEISKTTITPAQVTDLAVTAGANGELKATLAWTNPTKNNVDGDLASFTGVKVMRGTEQIADIAGEVGQEMTYTDNTITEPGTYKYSVIAYNPEGDAKGNATEVTSAWIGNDTPKAVTEFTATANEDVVSLTWTLPAEGTHSGYINPAEVTYRITRDGTALQEAWQGELPYCDTVGALAKYTYKVIPTFDGKTGSGNTAVVVAGGAYTVPYTESFDLSESLDFFTLFHNVGTYDWRYYSRRNCVQFWGGNTADAWLITPDIKMEAGKTYKVTFDTGLENASQTLHYKDLHVTLGQGKTAEAQATEIFNEQIQTAVMTGKEAYFKVPTSGNYNLGFRVLGQSSSYAVFVDNIHIEESQVVPAAAENLQATPITPGAELPYQVRVSFNLPSKDLAGSDLEQIDSLKVMMNGEVILNQKNEETHLTPGVPVLFTNAVNDPGFYTFEVITYVGDRVSPTATVKSAWVGHDTPAAVTDVTLLDNSGHPQVEFTAPTEGVNGGYIDASTLTYRIVRNPGEIEVAEAHNSNVFVDQETLDLNNYSYTVYASVATPAGRLESAGAESNKQIFGDAMDLPYETAMDDANHMALWTFIDRNADGKTWKHKNNMLVFDSFTKADDYAMTPPLHIMPGKCKLTYTVKGYNYKYSDPYEVVLTNTLDTANFVAAAPSMLMEEAPLYKVIESVEANALQSSTLTSREVEFTIEREGKYYLGFHDTATDGWAVSVGSVLVELTEPATGITDVAMNGFCYYNRATESLVVAGKADVTVAAINGATVAMVNGAEGSVNLSHLGAGMYVARVIIDGKQHVVKFIK